MSERNGATGAAVAERSEPVGVQGSPTINIGAGNGIRTRDFDLGKVALYH